MMNGIIISFVRKYGASQRHLQFSTTADGQQSNESKVSKILHASRKVNQIIALLMTGTLACDAVACEWAIDSVALGEPDKPLVEEPAGSRLDGAGDDAGEPDGPAIAEISGVTVPAVGEALASGCTWVLVLRAAGVEVTRVAVLVRMVGMSSRRYRGGIGS